MKYYIFDNKQDADDCRHLCLTLHLAACGDNLDYIETTTSWSPEGETRLTDGKYIVPYSKRLGMGDGNPVYTVEEHSMDWFPASEVID